MTLTKANKLIISQQLDKLSKTLSGERFVKGLLLLNQLETELADVEAMDLEDAYVIYADRAEMAKESAIKRILDKYNKNIVELTKSVHISNSQTNLPIVKYVDVIHSTYSLPSDTILVKI